MLFRLVSLVFTTALLAARAEAACPDPGAFDIGVQQTIIAALTGTANSCVNNNAGVDPAQACNIFVGAGLQSAYNMNDFYVPASTHYYTSDELLKVLPTLNPWTEIGTADSDDSLLEAQKDANLGQPVVAVAPGHVALIIPGLLTQVPSWQTCAPYSASESIDPNGPHYIGKPLSFAWKKADRPSIQMWTRTLGV